MLHSKEITMKLGRFEIDGKLHLGAFENELAIDLNAAKTKRKA